jgi:hypothetical protein
MAGAYTIVKESNDKKPQEQEIKKVRKSEGLRL